MSCPTALLSRVSNSASRSPSLFLRLRTKTLTPQFSLSSSSPISRSRLPDSTKRFCLISRLPLNLRCLGSMLPLHSAIASARLNSILSAESQSWGLIPQVDAILWESEKHWRGDRVALLKSGTNLVL